MSNVLLSIQIPYTDERQEDFDKLFVELGRQIIDTKEYGEVEILWDSTGKEMPIGEKREKLYKMANSLFVWQIDSDDWVAHNAIHLILEAIKSNPDVDCITFEEHIDIDSKIQRSNHSLKYDDWHDNFDGFDYVRTPFMKDVIKTEIAKSVPIPHIRFGEDHQWAQALKPHLHTEIHIDEQIYRYIHRSSDFNERYGIIQPAQRKEHNEPTNY